MLVPSSQNGMHTPEIESRIWKPPRGSLGFLMSQRPSWRSLMREKPVVATLSCPPGTIISPMPWSAALGNLTHPDDSTVLGSRMTLTIIVSNVFVFKHVAYLTGTSWTGFSCLTSQTRSFLSRLVVTRNAPSALHDIDWKMSVPFSVRRD